MSTLHNNALVSVRDQLKKAGKKFVPLSDNKKSIPSMSKKEEAASLAAKQHRTLHAPTTNPHVLAMRKFYKDNPNLK